MHLEDTDEAAIGMMPLVAITGYLLRRIQQVHNVMWVQTLDADLTSPQYAVLSTLASFPNIDQQRVGQIASLDKSSVADVVARLVRRSWIARERDERDARHYVLSLTPAASIALSSITPQVTAVQDALLAPLPQPRRQVFVDGLASVARLRPEDIADTGTDRKIAVLDLRAPGHLIRRAQQIHTAIWADLLNGQITGPQYAVMHVVSRWPGINQTQLGELAALDRSSTADIVARLVRRGWLHRDRHADDGRVRVLYASDLAARELAHIHPRVAAVQERLLEPLPSDVRTGFVADLARVAFVGDPPPTAE
jgi:DNA-binding MarR family transcriptional regulator